MGTQGGDPVLPGWPCQDLAWGRRKGNFWKRGKGSVWERGRSEEGEGTLRAPPAPCQHIPEHAGLLSSEAGGSASCTPTISPEWDPSPRPASVPVPALPQGEVPGGGHGMAQKSHWGGAGAQVPSPGGLHPPVGAPWGSPNPALQVPAQRGEKFAANWFEGRRAGTCRAHGSPGWERGMGAMAEPAAPAVLLPAPGGA